MRNGIFYECDDCGKASAQFPSYNKARKARWAVSKDYKYCYCPNCAPNHRNGAATAKNYEAVEELPVGWEQLRINDLK